MEADYAGVDLLHADDGRTLVIEVNGIPGWRGLQQTTRVDVATVIAEQVMATRARPAGPDHGASRVGDRPTGSRGAPQAAGRPRLAP